jgi:hypothetical protein
MAVKGDARKEKERNMERGREREKKQRKVIERFVPV